MARLIQVESDQHEVKCSECEMIFTLIWQKSYWNQRMEYCPFCGEEIEEDGNEFDD